MTNYELNRTESHFASSPGKVSLLSVAVWLNGQYSPNQLAAVEESISRAIGLQPSRGDSIYVNAVPFESTSMWADTPVVQYVEAPSYLMYIIAGALLLALGAAVLILRSRRRQETVLAPAAAGLDVVVTDEMVEALTQAERTCRNCAVK